MKVDYIGTQSKESQESLDLKRGSGQQSFLLLLV